MNPTVETIRGTIDNLLDRGYVAVTRRTIEAIVASTNDPNGLIQQRLAELEAEVERLKADDVNRLSPDNPVLRALTADLEIVMGRNQSRVDALGDDVQTAAVDVSGEATKQMAFPGMTDGQIRLVMGVDWASADPEVMNRLVQYVDMPEWADEVGQYGRGVVATVNNQAIRGMAQGWSSIRVSREIRKIAENLPASVANTLTRTLYNQSYRSGTTIHQNANIQLIDQVIRVESLDGRICMACVYLHGDIVWDSRRDVGTPIVRIDEHHNGRGTTMSKVFGREVTVGRGEDWFMGLDAGRQRDLMRNDAAFDAWQAGAVQLRDFVKPYEDRVFGSMVRQASLQDMLGEGARAWYR